MTVVLIPYGPAQVACTSMDVAMASYGCHMPEKQEDPRDGWLSPCLSLSKTGHVPFSLDRHLTVFFRTSESGRWENG